MIKLVKKFYKNIKVVLRDIWKERIKGCIEELVIGVLVFIFGMIFLWFCIAFIFMPEDKSCVHHGSSNNVGFNFPAYMMMYYSMRVK